MNRNQKLETSSVKKVAAKFVAFGRKFGAEVLLAFAAIGASWTAGVVPPQLSKVA